MSFIFYSFYLFIHLSINIFTYSPMVFVKNKPFGKDRKRVSDLDVYAKRSVIDFTNTYVVIKNEVAISKLNVTALFKRRGFIVAEKCFPMIKGKVTLCDMHLLIDMAFQGESCILQQILICLLAQRFFKRYLQTSCWTAVVNTFYVDFCSSQQFLCRNVLTKREWILTYFIVCRHI